MPLAYGFGRELLGRAGGGDGRGRDRGLAGGRAPGPVRPRLHRDAGRLPSSACGCCWCCSAPAGRAGSALRAGGALLAASHPFGLFALFSELILLVLLGVAHAAQPRAAATAGLIAVRGGAAGRGRAAGAAPRLRAAPEQVRGGQRRRGGRPVSTAVLAAAGRGLVGHPSPAGGWCWRPRAGRAGRAGRRDRRAAICAASGSCSRCSRWRAHRASSDFAPERHLSFLLPGLRGRARGRVLELARRVRRRGPLVAAARC